MSTVMKLHSGASIRNVAQLLLAGLLVSGLSYGHPGQDKPAKAPETRKEKIAEEIEKARQENSPPMFYAEQLAEAGAVEAIPMLEEKFARMPDRPSKYPFEDVAGKAQVASALVRLGDKKEIYWDYLVKQATLAVKNDAPDPLSYDSNGKATVSPEWIAWVKAHKLGHPGVVDEYVYGGFAAPVILLGVTGDPRAVPVLRRGLLSPNYLVKDWSAEGLAQIGDEASVPFIIEACKKAPPKEAAAIARSLVYFDDPEAQEAVDKYIPNDQAKLYREDRARGKKKPFFTPGFTKTIIPPK